LFVHAMLRGPWKELMQSNYIESQTSGSWGYFKGLFQSSDCNSVSLSSVYYSCSFGSRCSIFVEFIIYRLTCLLSSFCNGYQQNTRQTRHQEPGQQQKHNEERRHSHCKHKLKRANKKANKQPNKQPNNQPTNLTLTDCTL